MKRKRVCKRKSDEFAGKSSHEPTVKETRVYGKAKFSRRIQLYEIGDRVLMDHERVGCWLLSRKDRNQWDATKIEEMKSPLHVLTVAWDDIVAYQTIMEGKKYLSFARLNEKRAHLLTSILVMGDTEGMCNMVFSPTSSTMYMASFYNLYATSLTGSQSQTCRSRAACLCAHVYSGFMQLLRPASSPFKDLLLAVSLCGSLKILSMQATPSKSDLLSDLLVGNVQYFIRHTSNELMIQTESRFPLQSCLTLFDLPTQTLIRESDCFQTNNGKYFSHNSVIHLDQNRLVVAASRYNVMLFDERHPHLTTIQTEAHFQLIDTLIPFPQYDSMAFLLYGINHDSDNCISLFV